LNAIKRDGSQFFEKASPGLQKICNSEGQRKNLGRPKLYNAEETCPKFKQADGDTEAALVAFIFLNSVPRPVPPLCFP
jgi:hypothetical protein